MLDSFGQFLALPVVVWVVLFVHVGGHYYTGRQIVGIPGEEMQFVSLLVPRHVALRTEEGTLVGPPSFERFRAVYERHDPSYDHFERFVAGGEIIQVLVVVPAGIVLALLGFATLGGILLGSSILLTAVFVLQDAVRTRRSGSPSGDYSALWRVSPRIPVLILLAFLFVHLGAFYFVL